jgi:glycosyltransferase involved in cell wall biosynthesis
MNIAFFHELHAGGARRSVNEFAKRLKKEHRVDLYFIDEEPNPKEQKFFSAVHFFKFVPKKWSGGNWKAKLYKDTIELYKLSQLHRRIAKEINDRNYNLIFLDPSRFTQAPFILRYLQKKKVYYCQEPLRMVYEEILGIPEDVPFIKYQYERLNRMIRKKIDRTNIHHADVLLANSKYTKSNIKAAYGLESTVAYMGVDIKIFKPDPVKKDIDILFVGAYDVAGGYSLFDAAKKYMKEKVAIKILATEKQWITNDILLRELYCRAKIIVALANNEPFGLIPLEAMSCGVPVVAVSEGGYRETVINNKTGYLIPRYPKVLAQRLDYLLRHPEVLQKMGRNARSEMEKNWTWDKRTEELGRLLQATVDKK